MSVSWGECINAAERLLRESAQDAATADTIEQHLRVIESLLGAQAFIALAESKRERR